MKAIFWSSVLFIAYVYLGYPAWLYIASRLRKRSWKRERIYPSISLVMAVHNCASQIQEKIDHLLSIDYPAELTEIIIVSDGSHDGTNELLEGQKDPRLKIKICAEQRGKAAAVTDALSLAQNEIIVFVDIRPWIEQGSLQQLLSNFADPEVGCVAGELVLRPGDHDAGTAAIGGLYWRYEQRLRIWESAVDSPVGVYGGFYAVRRVLAAPLPAGLILDDMYQPLSVIRQGFRSVLDVNARVFDMWPQTASGEFQRKVRTLAGNFQLLKIAPWILFDENRLRWQLINHKLLRLVVPYLLLSTLITSAILSSRPLYGIIFAIQLAIYVIAVLTISKPLGKLGGAIYGFCVLNVAAVVGLWKFIFHSGPLWTIWTSSTRTAKIPLSLRSAQLTSSKTE